MAKYTQKRRRRYAICRNRRKTKYSGGGQSNPRTTTSEAVSMQSYPLNDGASSQRESSYIAGQNATARHQIMLDTHGGTRRFNQTSNVRNRLSKTAKRNHRHMRGGESTNRTTVSTQPIVVPSFNTGNDISPVNPTSLSQSANILKMQSGANSANDCYATGSCLSQSGGQQVFANWRDAYPAGSFGKEMTGGKNRRAKRNK